MLFATRFAPSPTGYLHKGHAFSALTAWRAAQAAGGRFVLRIEDTDHTRCRPHFEASIYEDLAWLGLQWEMPVLRQSERRRDYQTALDRLRDEGLLYRCFRTRSEMKAAAAAPVPLDPDLEAKRLERGDAFAWRLSLARVFEQAGDLSALTWRETGQTPETTLTAAALSDQADPVLGRKDIGSAYVLASVIDDARQGITHIIRGQDLLQLTPLQRLLQTLLDLPTPVYCHHRLILDEHGKRLAKRDHSTALATFRAEGLSVADLKSELGLD